MENVTIAKFDSFNFRRYSVPWVCLITKKGEYDFSTRIGTYTADGKSGEKGELVVFNPVVNQVYAYGQKDYRGRNTRRYFAVWDGEKFAPCDKLGRIKES